MAKRVAYRCSKPDCGIPTIGASSDKNKATSVGYAAHITAASPKGPRYDSSLTSELRKHLSNGIWLCGNHAKLIDSDEGSFLVEDLIRWKQQAELKSLTAVVSSNTNPAPAIRTIDENLQTAFDMILDSSKRDLASFLESPWWPSHAVNLNLMMVDEEIPQSFTATGLSKAIDAFDEISIIATPGTGKTTTLLQLTGAILDQGSFVAGFVPLSEWSTRSDTFIQSILRRASFRDTNERQFQLVAENGKLVLILDGWNELDDESKRRVRSDLKSLKRDYPDIRLVVSSRHKDFDLPIDGPVIEVEALSEEQQLDIAKALRGSEGASLMDHAWRTAGLRELVAIPFYLTALLKQVTGGALPTTKEEVLCSFVAEQEKDTDKLACLREALQGYHREFLEALAVEATRNETVALSEEQARATVNTVQDRLIAAKQMSVALPPMKVLDALASAHLLVRSGDESGGVSLQHQQFQEWFASFHVEHLLLSAASGDSDSLQTLREDVLNILVWEEAILFATDRLSRANEHELHAIARGVLEALQIDPMLAAEMIWRASDLVWEQVRKNVLLFVEIWHTEGRVDRAVRFMINTGRAEFSKYIWPLISDTNNQIHLRALRAGRTFRASVLGPTVKELIASLPEDTRENVASEIASNGGMDEIELATIIAKNDTSERVQEAVIGSLLFRRADRFASDILLSSSDDVWRTIARNWRSDDFSDPDITARLETEVADFYAEETDPHQILSALLDTNLRDPDASRKVRELVGNINFSEKSQNNEWLVHRAYELYPEDVVGGLISQLEQDRPVPSGYDELLRASDLVIDDGVISDRVFGLPGQGRKADMVVGVLGPKTVGKLIDQIFAIQAKIVESENNRRELNDEYYRLLDCISGTKNAVFIQSLLEHANTEKPEEIAILADLLSRHRGSTAREPFVLEDAALASVTFAVQQWAEILLASPEATRAHFAEIARAAERLASPLLVPVLQKLLSEDLARRNIALGELADARKDRRRIDNDAHMSWTLQYQRAFAAIGDDQTTQLMKSYLPDTDFGEEAALTLRSIFQKAYESGGDSGNYSSWPDFSMVADEFARRQVGAMTDTHPFVDDILTVVNSRIGDGADEAQLKHALTLASVAFTMPYDHKAETIDSLLKLPLPAIAKRTLLNNLVLSGETIPTELIIQGTEELLEEAEKKPWMLQEQEGWRLNCWLRLFPFSDSPSSIFKILDSLDAHLLPPWKLRGLLSALGNSPSREIENILSELAIRDTRFILEYEWQAALTKRNTLTAVRILFDLICSGSLPGKEGAGNTYDLGMQLSGFMTSHKEFRQEVYDRFLYIEGDTARAVLEKAIANSPDVDGILLLILEHAARNKVFSATLLYSALRKVVVEHRPIEFSSMHEVYSVPVPELRKGLFDLVVNGNITESRLATDCLNAIDEIRDDYGCVVAETRHPDIAAGIPWPKIAPVEPA